MSKRKSTPTSNHSNQKTVVESSVESTPSKPISQWVYVGIAMLFVLIAIIARTKLASIPFERDEGTYSLIGQLLLEGKKCYVDFYEMKLPGLFYCYAAVAAFFGKTIEGMHLGFMVITLISTIAVFFSAKLLFDTRAAAVAAISFSILTLNKFASGFTAQAEHLVVMWAMLGLWFTLRAMNNGRKWEYLIAGFFLGMSLLIKPAGAFFALGAGLFMAINYLKPLNIKQLLIDGSLLVGGFAISLAIFLGIVAMQGTWSEMMFWMVDIPKSYVSALPFSTPDPNDYDGMRMLSYSMNQITESHKGLWYFGGLGVILIWISKTELYKKAGITLLLILAFISVSPGLRFYGHYFIQFMPALALALAACVYSADDVLNKLNIKVGGTVVFVLFLLISFVVVNSQKEYYFSPNQFQILREVYGMNPFVESKPVADKVKSMANPGDQLMVWGSEPQINFYAQMPSPTRHTFIAVTNIPLEKTKAWREEIKKDVDEKKPRFMVICNHGISWQMRSEQDQELFKYAYETANKYYDLVGYADMIPGQKPVFVWDQAALTYKPKGKEYLVVFKRKEGM